MNEQLPTIPAEGTVALSTPDAPTRRFATRDRQVIRSWAARHSAEPATGEATASGPATVDVHDGGVGIRFNFPGIGRFRPITWDEWFEHFERYHLLFVYDEEVADRAYERWRGRGGQHGHDREDWLEAERELQGTAGQGSAGYRFLQQDPAVAR